MGVPFVCRGRQGVSGRDRAVAGWRMGPVAGALAAALVPAATTAQDGPVAPLPPASESALHPRSAFVQGAASERSSALTVGFTWALPQRLDWLGSHWRPHLEASAARWTPRDRSPGDPSHFTRIGLTPALRYSPQEGTSRWFLEAGVGLNLIGPVYRVGDKRFGSAFNFGDHVAIGWIPDSGRRQEVILRLQHFSNAGLRPPNPGENFLQLRWAWRF